MRLEFDFSEAIIYFFDISFFRCEILHGKFEKISRDYCSKIFSDLQLRLIHFVLRSALSNQMFIFFFFLVYLFLCLLGFEKFASHQMY